MSLQDQQSKITDKVHVTRVGETADQSSILNSSLPPMATPPPSLASTTHIEKEKSKPWKDVRIWIEVIGLTAVIIYTIFSILQWQQIRWTNRLTREALDGSNATLQQTLTKMQGQIDATNRLATAAGDQAAVAKAANSLTSLANRPWLEVSSPRIIPDKNGTFHAIAVRISNGGRNPAFRVNENKIHLMIGEPLPKLGDPKSFPTVSACSSTQFYGSGHAVYIGGGYTTKIIQFSDDHITDDDMKEVMANNKGLYLVGCVDYTDSTEHARYRAYINEKFERGANLFSTTEAGPRSY